MNAPVQCWAQGRSESIFYDSWERAGFGGVGGGGIKGKEALGISMGREAFLGKRPVNERLISLHLALFFLLLTVRPLHINLQVAIFQRCKHAPVCQLLCCTTVLFKILHCKIKNVDFFMYYLCEKYYTPIIIQYYIPNCGSWSYRLIR